MHTLPAPANQPKNLRQIDTQHLIYPKVQLFQQSKQAYIYTKRKEKNKNSKHHTHFYLFN